MEHTKTRDPLATRLSLLSRIKDLEDEEGWRQFFDTYWKLIHYSATKAGLHSDEADDVVQKVVATVYDKIQEFTYDPARSFRGWLLKTTGWKIVDRFRERFPPGGQDVVVDEVPDPARPDLEVVWDTEWSRSLLHAGMEMLRQKISPLQYQIYECYVIKEWPVEDVISTLGVSRAQVYLAKLRVGRVLRYEIKRLEKRLV